MSYIDLEVIEMEITIELGQVNDIDELENLYNDLNDYLAEGANYP
jgi:hypothetical protein